jgi:hypothetical protein
MEKIRLEPYKAYGRLTIKFLETNNLFGEVAWTLTEYQNRVTGIAEVTSIDGEEQRQGCAVNVIFDNGFHMNWGMEVEKSEAEDIWNDLNESGFKISADTRKKMEKLQLL